MKKPVSIILTIALLLTFAIFALGSSSGNNTTVTKDTQTQKETKTQKETREENNSQTQNDSQEQNDSSSENISSNDRTEIHVGETLNIDDFKITFDSAERWESDNQFIQPGEGKQYIRIHLSIANDTKTDQYLSGFDCYADGEKCDDVYYGDDTLSFVSLSSGRKASGYVYFEVPVDADEIEVEYETSIWTNEKAYFIVEF